MPLRVRNNIELLQTNLALLLRDDVIVEYGSGHGKVAVTLGVLAGVDLKIVGFERDTMQYQKSQDVLLASAELGIKGLKEVNSHGVILIVEE